MKNLPLLSFILALAGCAGTGPVPAPPQDLRDAPIASAEPDTWAIVLAPPEEKAEKTLKAPFPAFAPVAARPLPIFPGR